jgi:ribonuclease BN (tRNA processing enzyme)
MELRVVGSGPVIPEAGKGGSCYFLEAGGRRLLLDCGPGAGRGLVEASCPWDELTDLVLTHFHADHVGGIPGFFFSLKHGTPPGWAERPLRVTGPPGTRRLFEAMASAFGDYVLAPGCPLEIRELAPREEIELRGTLLLRTHPTPHTDESQALRLELGTDSIGYTGDTGPSEALGPFFEGVDLLVAECSLLDEEVGDNHLSPTRVARLARAAGPELLLLTHIYPHVRSGSDLEALVRAAGYTGALELAREGETWRTD